LIGWLHEDMQNAKSSWLVAWIWFNLVQQIHTYNCLVGCIQKSSNTLALHLVRLPPYIWGPSKINRYNIEYPLTNYYTCL
jgi:hypothetical protein